MYIPYYFDPYSLPLKKYNFQLLRINYPSLKEYGGLIDSFEDIKELLKKHPCNFDIAALELEINNIYEIFTDEMLEYLKNTVHVYAEAFDPNNLTEGGKEFRKINEHCIGQNENLWKRVIEKYGWDNESKTT